MDRDIISSPNSKYTIRGYTGFRPYRRAVVGEPRIPNEEKQHELRRSLSRGNITDAQQSHDYEESVHSLEDRKIGKPPSPEMSTSQFRAFAKHMDIIERYNTATQQILERGQTQQQLLETVKEKLDARALSRALQQIRTRKLFESFDLNKDGFLDEKEFRFCIEMLNIQYDDVQALALFAYFDDNNDGFIDWEEFAEQLLDRKK
jgi:hypothetical protein